MAFANKSGYMVCNTGNKSESAVGYATLYGDMCGALSVLGDIYKTEVYLLADYINRNGVVIPEKIINKEPSAELSENQKDSDVLPDYETLDKILKCYIEKRMSPLGIARQHDISYAAVKDVIEKLHKSEYKRRQSPMSIRVSRYSLSAQKLPIQQSFY